MTDAAESRILGLSPKARRFVLPFLAVAVAVVAVGSLASRQDASSDASGPTVGGDLHAVGQLGNRLFVGGHDGAGFRAPTGGWTQIATLDNKDVMGWAASGQTLLAGGHAGLYSSTDDGSTFDPVPGLPISDVHALGASGRRVYIGSPETGTLMSNDGGKTFKQVSSTGQDFMGTIWIDPSDPDTAIAPSMQAGAVKSTDGGTTWAVLGSSGGSMAVAVDPTGMKIIAIGMTGAEQSTDGGGSWSPLVVPDGASAAAYTSRDGLVAAVLSGDRAEVYQSVDGKWDPLT